MIWGSSSRGVSTTARTPSISEARTMRGVSLLRRKALASLPARPRRDSLAMAHSAGHFDGLAVLEGAGMVDDLLAVLQARTDRQVGPVSLAQGEPTQLGMAVLRDEHAREFTPLHKRGTGNRHARCGGQAGHQDARERALAKALGLEHLGPQGALVAVRVATRCEAGDLGLAFDALGFEHHFAARLQALDRKSVVEGKRRKL